MADSNLDRSNRSALLRAFEAASKQNLAIKQDERVLVVTDAEKEELGGVAAEACRSLAGRVELLEMPVLSFNGQEPPDFVAQALLDADVALLVLSKSLSWTRARVAASERGVRIATMPGITAEIAIRTLPVDYAAIRGRVNRLCDCLDMGNKVEVRTELGTSLRFSIEGRLGRGRKGGIYTQPGHWGNLPCGEAFIAPVEGTAEGVYVVDASQAGVGEVRDPIRIKVEAGRAVGLAGGAEAETLSRLLASIGDPKAYNLAEFGIGCNHAATVCGITLEDEKSLGTCHFALGNNAAFGGTVEVGIHVDGVLRDPSIWIDGKQVMDCGRPGF